MTLQPSLVVLIAIVNFQNSFAREILLNGKLKKAVSAAIRAPSNIDFSNPGKTFPDVNTTFLRISEDIFKDTGEKSANDPVVPVSVLLIHQTAECIYGHDKIRELYNAGKLHWDSDLAYGARKWALKLAVEDNGAYHSSFVDENGVQYGENIYWYRGSDQKHCHDAIHLWYKEYEDYDFVHPQFTYSAGHFIQLVWEPTYNVGVGISYAHDQTWIVARYTPSEKAESADIHEHVNIPHGNPNVPISDIISSSNPVSFVEMVYVTNPPSQTTNCMDSNDYCSYWHSIGECVTSKEFMEETCPKICGFCTVGNPINGGWTKWSRATACSVSCGDGTYEMHRYCINPEPSNGGKYCRGDWKRIRRCQRRACVDDSLCSNYHKDCDGYKQLGYCDDYTYENWMSIYCRESCGLCCENLHKDCDGYMELGYCKDSIYEEFMKLHCPLSCNLCSN